MENKNVVEFWVVVASAGVAAIGWIIKTYTTFAKQKTVDRRFEAEAENNDKRFAAIQERLMKIIDELKLEVREQAKMDKAMGKELHKRIDKVLEQSHTLTMTIGELKGAINTTRTNES